VAGPLGRPSSSGPTWRRKAWVNLVWARYHSRGEVPGRGTRAEVETSGETGVQRPRDRPRLLLRSLCMGPDPVAIWASFATRAFLARRARVADLRVLFMGIASLPQHNGHVSRGFPAANCVEDGKERPRSRYRPRRGLSQPERLGRNRLFQRQCHAVQRVGRRHRDAGTQSVERNLGSRAKPDAIMVRTAFDPREGDVFHGP
jgi:hypothetical protein